MLLNLKISNYALIDNLDIDFTDEFTVISGDTGSGKSIILDAINLILGKRIDKKKLNSKKCIVEASFKINDKHLNFFKENDLDFENITLIRREININGKIRNFINDTPVSANILSKFSSLIIEVHAQHENLLIKNKIEQLNLIDKVADNSNVLTNYQNLFNSYNDLKDSLTSFLNKRLLNDDEYNLYKFHYNEIIDSKLRINEDLELEKEISFYENLTHNLEIIKKSNHLISSEDLILDNLNLIKNYLSKSDKFIDLENRISSAIIDLNDVSNELQILSEELISNNTNIQKLNLRYDVINSLMRKHNVNTILELFEIRDSIKVSIDKYENFENEKNIINDKLNTSFIDLENASVKLSKSRSTIIPNFESQIKDILKTLGMPHAIFKVCLEKTSNFNITGSDNIVFKFSSNPGVNEQEISKVASGGEISRLVLALKNIISTKVGIKTLIFDEIDTGVSGKIASFMGDMMRSISKTTQLISITHLPQIASKSQKHIKVYKEVLNGSTRTRIKILNKEERIIEIARLLSGKDISKAAITNAKELLNQ
ncbi:DNA repair protein RecN [Flavobacteriales bacterium]|nr:DNA repair protein RecN [Flavobacteriales bacterium]